MRVIYEPEGSKLKRTFLLWVIFILLVTFLDLLRCTYYGGVLGEEVKVYFLLKMQPISKNQVPYFFFGAGILSVGFFTYFVWLYFIGFVRQVLISGDKLIIKHNGLLEKEKVFKHREIKEIFFDIKDMGSRGHRHEVYVARLRNIHEKEMTLFKIPMGLKAEEGASEEEIYETNPKIRIEQELKEWMRSYA